MLTGTTFEAVAILALIAVVHTFVSTFIVTRLTAGEKTDAARVSAPPPRLSAVLRPTISSQGRLKLTATEAMVRIN